MKSKYKTAKNSCDLIPTEYNDENYLPLLYSAESRNKTKTSYLLRGTKNLVLNSSKYNNYIKNYATLTQVKSFKDPDTPNYPITKNSHILSMSSKKFGSEVSSPMFKTVKHFFKRKEDKRKSERRVDMLKKKFSQNIEVRNTLDLYKLSSLESFVKCFEVEFDILNKIKDPKYFKDFLKERVAYLVLGENENITARLYKSFNIGTSDEVEIVLNSLKISLYNKEVDGKELHIYLPFALLPIIYYVKSDIFKIILAKAITFNDNEDDINIDYDYLNDILKKMKKVITAGIEKVDRKDYHLAFEWLTPKNTYNVVITMPIIEFALVKRKYSFFKYIEKEFMLYLLQNNFVQWDTNLLNYLIRYKIFREQIHTNKPEVTGGEGSSILLDKFAIIVDSKNHNTFTTQKRAKEGFFNFFVTDESYITKLYKVKSYNFQVYMNLFENNNKFSYHFNFSHMFTLEKVRKLTELKDYLAKTLMINYRTQAVGLDSKYFDNIDDHHLKFFIDINNQRTIDKNINYKVM
jgi:hypothetical protein